MSATVIEIPVSAPSAPPPDVDRERAVRPVDRLEIIDLATDRAASYRCSEDFLAVDEVHEVREPTRGAIAVSQDEDGGFVIQDVLGAVYGAGGTFDEALADLLIALDDHLAFLRERRDELDPRLLTQLMALERLFPGH